MMNIQPAVLFEDLMELLVIVAQASGLCIVGFHRRATAVPLF
jgi:hypothetical protein